MKLRQLILILCVLPTGCVSDLNQQVGLLDAPPPPALAVEDLPSELDNQPSVDAIARDDWPVIVVELPVRQTRHYPDYVTLVQIGDKPERSAGDYPTPLTALESRSEISAEIAEGGLETLEGAAFALLAPIRMATGEWPWQIQRSPQLRYERVAEGSAKDVRPWVSPDTPSLPE